MDDIIILRSLINIPIQISINDTRVVIIKDIIPIKDSPYTHPNDIHKVIYNVCDVYGAIHFNNEQTNVNAFLEVKCINTRVLEKKLKLKLNLLIEV